MNETVLAATLSRNTSLYNVKLFTIAQWYGSLEKLYALWKEGRRNEIPEQLFKQLSEAWSDTNLQEMKEQLRRHHIQTYLHSDNRYPRLLREIPDKPYVLYIRGDISVVNNANCLSCVGTRTMSSYGKRVIQVIIAGLKESDICIISGLALGVDGEVHRYALQNDIKTVAVLGGGLDRNEPVTNDALGQQIAQSGCLISEYPPGVRPQKHHFLERNRIIAGLSRATIVIEGKRHSGSLVTARYALKYGREVGTVPGDIFSPNSEGPLQLLRDGAWPIASADDILGMLGLEWIPRGSEIDRGPVHARLKMQSSTIDSLESALTISIADIRAQLTLLELDGLVAVNGLGEYYLTTA